MSPISSERGAGAGRWLVARLLLATGLTLPALALAGCGGEAARPATPLTVSAPTAVVELMTVPATRTVGGTVRSATVSPLAASVVGEVTAVRVAAGDRVRAGQVLVEIDSREARAQSAAASSTALAAKAEAELADTTWKRFAALRERRAVSQQELDEAQARRDASQAGLARANAGIEQARSALAHGTVRAPRDGVVVARFVDPGNQAAPGVILLTIEESGASRVEVAVAEDQLVRAGDPVTLEWAAGETGPDTASVTRLQPTLDAVSRSSLVQIDLPRAVRSGTFVRVTFSRGTRRMLAVPAAALMRHGALTSVFVVGADRVARLRLVTVGDGNEVLSGLDPGERVVTAPALVRDGMRVP